MTAGEFLYRHRGWLPVPAIVYALAFAEPRPALALPGAAAMLAGEALRLWAAAHLGPTARSSRVRVGRLVVSGPYAHTRHPLYWGNLLLTVGFLLLTAAPPAWFAAGVLALFLLVYRRHALAEEAALRLAEPDRYAAWAGEVPRWGWRRRPSGAAGGPGKAAGDLRRAFRVEALTLNAEFWLLAALWARVSLLGRE